MTQSLCLFVDNRINNSLQDGSPANLLIAFAKVGPSMSSIVVKASTHLVIMSQLSLVWSHWYKYFGLVHNPFFMIFVLFVEDSANVLCIFIAISLKLPFLTGLMTLEEMLMVGRGRASVELGTYRLIRG